MFKQLHLRFKKISPLAKLSVLFSLNWLWWFLSSLIGDWIFYDKEHSIVYHLFDATFMAFFWTLLWNFTIIKLVLKKVKIKVQPTLHNL